MNDKYYISGLNIFLSFILLVCLIFVADRTGGWIMHHVHIRSNDTTAPKLRYIAEDCNDELVIFGASRAGSHYRADIISDSLKMSVYNAGIDGSNNIYSHYMALSLLLEHHRPDVVILEVMDADYSKQESPYSALPVFAPYIGKSAGVDSILYEFGDGLLYKHIHLLRYNAKAVSNLGGLLKNESNHNKGFVEAPSGKLSNENLIFESLKEVDNNKLIYLEKFILKCLSNNIKLVMTISPRYTKASYNLYDPIKQMARQYNIPFIDNHTTGLYHDNPELFRDRTHLNAEGAKIYTQKYITQLKRVL